MKNPFRCLKKSVPDAPYNDTTTTSSGTVFNVTNYQTTEAKPVPSYDYELRRRVADLEARQRQMAIDLLGTEDVVRALQFAEFFNRLLPGGAEYKVEQVDCYSLVARIYNYGETVFRFKITVGELPPDKEEEVGS